MWACAIGGREKKESDRVRLKRFQAHARVADMESSMRWRSTLYGTGPAR